MQSSRRNIAANVSSSTLLIELHSGEVGMNNMHSLHCMCVFVHGSFTFSCHPFALIHASKVNTYDNRQTGFMNLYLTDQVHRCHMYCIHLMTPEASQKLDGITTTNWCSCSMIHLLLFLYDFFCDTQWCLLVASLCADNKRGKQIPFGQTNMHFSIY